MAPEKIIEEKNTTFIVRLFNGDIPLVITYWVFGSLIGFFLNIVYVVIEFSYIELVTSEILLLLVQLFLWFTVAYMIFIYVAIWRSAGKYQGRAVWSALARLVVVLGGLALAGNLIQGMNKDTALQNDIDMTNKSLPMKVDEETRFDRLSLEEGNVNYNYTLVNWTIASQDMEAIGREMSSRIKSFGCEEPETRALLDEGRELRYKYRDKDGKPAINIIVTKKDCFYTEKQNVTKLPNAIEPPVSYPSEIFSKNNEAVVLVRSYDENGGLVGFGTGFNIHENGVIVTSLHVIISGGSYLDVKFSKHGTYDDVFIAGLSDADTDLAVLKIDGKELPTVNITDNNQILVGEKIYTIGNPEGLVNTMSEGIISAERVSNGTKLYQITAPISEGSSGGPVFNKLGDVIGVTSMVMKEGQNLNFAISIDEVEKIKKIEEYFTLKDLVDYVNKKVE